MICEARECHSTARDTEQPAPRVLAWGQAALDVSALLKEGGNDERLTAALARDD